MSLFSRLRAAARRLLNRDWEQDTVRCVLTAKAVKRRDPKYTFPDSDLAPYDISKYDA
jgi:hypothetical protein